MGMSAYLENHLIDFLFRGFSFSAPTTLGIALVTSVPTDADTGATIQEVTGAGYARVAVPPSPSNWVSSNGTTTGPSTGAVGATNNANNIIFSTAQENWGTVVAVVILDGLTIGTGNIIFWGSLTTPITVHINEIFQFQTGQLQIQIDG